MKNRSLLETVSEKDFMEAVMQLLTANGWWYSHQRPARSKKGWRTALQGHPGFFDIVAIRHPRVLFIECKSERGTVSLAQAGWINEAAHCPGVETYTWRPSDRDEIEKMLA